MARTAAQALPMNLRLMLEELASADVAAGQRWIVALLQQHGAAVVAVLWRMLGREEDVLDVYQSVVCKLVSRGPKGAGRDRAAYFYRSATNGAISLIRRRQGDQKKLARLAERQTAATACPNPAASMEHLNAAAALRSALAELPASLRDVIVLRELGGLSYAQVSKIMGITVGSARVYRRQAIVRLAEMLNQEAL